jgi:hypothetical protein
MSPPPAPTLCNPNAPDAATPCAPSVSNYKNRATLCPTAKCSAPNAGGISADGPTLVTEWHTEYEQAARPAQGAIDGKGKHNYVKDLKGWAFAILVWSVINTYFLFQPVEGDIEPIEEGAMVIYNGIICITVGLNAIMFIGGLVCLLVQRPWPGFYILFGLYLLSVGLLNMTGGGFWLFMGIFQIGLSISLFINFSKYRSSPQDMADIY